MRRLSILFLIFLIITISGCIGQVGIPIVSTNDGIIITDFSFENSPIYPGDSVGLYLEVHNVGGSMANLNRIQVYGVSFNDLGPDSTANEWGRRNSDTDLVDDEIGNRELYQPDLDVGFEGDRNYYEWRLRAPKEVTSQTNYDFLVRVKYNYSTTYSGMIRIIDDTYLQSLKEEQKQKLLSSGGIVSSKTTIGPISVTPFSGRHFIVTENEVDSESRKLKFKIENVGRGYPYINGKRDHIRIKDIVGDRNVIVNCAEEDNWEIKLSLGKSHIIECELKPPGINSFTNKKDISFQIIFEYLYYVDGSTSITVNPPHQI